MMISAMNPIKLAELKGTIDALTKPATGDRKSARALNDKGLQALKNENFGEAVLLLQKAVATDISDVEIRNNFVYALIKTKKLDEAEKEAGNSLTLSPGRSSAWANLAEIYAADGKINEAAAALIITFQFSSNKDKTLVYLKEKASTSEQPKLQEAATIAMRRLNSGQ